MTDGATDAEPPFETVARSIRTMTSWEYARRVVSDAEDAELLASRYMRRLGLSDAQVTPRGADGGIDVRASHALAQVKFRANVTSRPDLQRLFGARGHATHLDLYFFSQTGYSSQALNYADDMGMLLFEYDVTGEVRPVNAPARQAVRRALERERAAQNAVRPPTEARPLPPIPVMPPPAAAAGPLAATRQPAWPPPNATWWGGFEVAGLAVAGTLAFLAFVTLMAGLAGDGTALGVGIVLALLSAPLFYAVARSRRAKTRPRVVAAPRAATAPVAPVVTVTPRRVAGIACEYDPTSRAVARVRVSTTGGSVVFERDGTGHSTRLEGFVGFADPEEVRQARGRARDELTRIGQPVWL